MRLVLAVLITSCSAYAQIDARAYSNLVTEWLKYARPWLESVNQTNDKWASAYSSLERRLPEDIRNSANWASSQQNQIEFQADLRAVSQVMEKDIAANERYQQQLSRPGSIEMAAVADNLIARAKFHQSVAEALGQFARVLNQIGDELRSLPQPAADFVEFQAAMRTRDAMSELMGNSAKEFASRGATYSAMGSGVVPILASSPSQREIDRPNSPWDVRAKIGEVTEFRPDVVLLATPEVRVDVEKAVRAGDEVGLKELLADGKILMAQPKSKILVIDIDASRYSSARKSIMSIVDIKLDGVRECLRDDIKRVKLGLPQHPCERIDIDREFAAEYAVLHPNLAPQDFVGELVFAKVRILDGRDKDRAGWARLADLTLPTHPSEDPPRR